MFRNYLKTAWRNLLKNKVYFLINTVGLSIAIAVSVLMLLWVFDEYSMNKYHEKDDQLYLVKRTIPLEDGILDVYAGISYPLLNAAKEKFPEVEDYITLGATFEDNLRIGDTDFRAPGAFTNAAFFKHFTVPILLGNVNDLDDKPESIAISESLAKRFWGEEWATKALGSPVHIYDNGDYAVAMVYADFPSQSSIQNDFYYGFNRHLSQNDWLLEWGNNGMQGAFLLREGLDIAQVVPKVEALFRENISGEFKEGILLQKFSDNYLHNQFDERAQVSGGRIEYVRIFTWAAIFLLVISCINFINLSTAYATKRASEIGVRKAIGAKKNMLIGQFFTETSLITATSFLAGIVITLLLLPFVNVLTNKNLGFDISEPQLWLTLLGVFLLTTFLSAVYPSFIISSFKPVAALKGLGKEQKSTTSFRKGLVVLQFSLALLLIISALVIQKQVDFVNQKDLGIAKNHIISIHQDEVLTQKYEALKNELMASEGIADVTLVGPSPLSTPASSSGVSWPGKTQEQENIEFALLWTAHNFPEAFEIPVKHGTYYREGTQDTLNLVVNYTAAQLMDLGDNPIGKTVQLWGSQRHIIGVVEDFHNRSLFEPIQPTVFLLDPNDAGEMMIKLDGNQTKTALASVHAVFDKVLPDNPLHYDFLDEEYAANYNAEILTGTLARYFALISVLLSCLGLFGLAAFTAKERTKEIGIRKVLGASVQNITVLVSKDFFKLIAIAILIASPLAYYFMSNWLNGFAYSINIPMFAFVLAGGLTLFVALLTIGFQSIKSATANPVKSLRTE
ncbi:FtsX-like permease family protein [Flagellimonas algicola]|uniref:FtsX-like permease family protein n=1 Tax=Flagellimonas algicola TaxID=2583815 RepID=A0ABY2WKW1_9FLAO|nr:FtsX-like permease family protein [Allomuricauda algicola]TMU55201.1 FtsX-like permease family protein [Allomuricauda algicola]